jgi:hypothetical protein
VFPLISPVAQPKPESTARDRSSRKMYYIHCIPMQSLWNRKYVLVRLEVVFSPAFNFNSRPTQSLRCADANYIE